MDIEKQRDRPSDSYPPSVSLFFWFIKFGFKYDLGLGVLIVVDWIGMYWIAFRFWLRFSFE